MLLFTKMINRIKSILTTDLDSEIWTSVEWTKEESLAGKLGKWRWFLQKNRFSVSNQEFQDQMEMGGTGFTCRIPCHHLVRHRIHPFRRPVRLK